MSDKRYKLTAVKVLFDQLSRHSRKLGVYDDTFCDPISSDIVWLALNECDQQGIDKVQLSSYSMANRLHTTRKRVRLRYHKLAHFGLVKVTTEWRNDGTNKRTPTHLQPSPYLIRILQPGTKPALKLEAVKHFVALGLERFESEERLQGFEAHCPYGQDIPEDEIRESDAMARLNQLVRMADTNKADKIREAELWRGHDEAFMLGAARLWVYAQSAMGHGTAQPNWSGETKNLSPTASKERRELSKTFRQYGGRITGLAWYIFVCGVPGKDGQGRVKFDLSVPHRQFASIDKKPSTFVKHFNAILKDPYFVRFAKKEWEAVYPSLKTYFQDVLDVTPFDGETPQLKLGYNIGDDVSLEDAQV